MTRTAPDFSTLSTTGVQVAMGPFLVRIRSRVDGVQQHLERLYPDFSVAAGEPGHFDIVVSRGRGVHAWVRPQASLVINGLRPFLPLPAALAGPSVEWGLNWCIGRNAHRWIAVHSAVVERHGRALLLPAPSGSGKSTLCAGLIGAGWRLLSDEFALIDPDTGDVVPIPRALSLKNAAIDIMQRRHPDAVFSPEAYDVEGARFVHMRPPTESVLRATERARPAFILVPRYVPGAPTTFAQLPKARALIHLTDSSFNYNFLGAEGFVCLANLVRTAECSSLEYSDLDDVLGALDRMAAS